MGILAMLRRIGRAPRDTQDADLSILDRRTTPRKSLIFTSAGDHNIIKSWLHPARTFDLFVVYYGDQSEPEAQVLADLYCRRKGVKFLNLLWAVRKCPSLFAHYDAVFVLDDDIRIAPEGIEALFTLRRDLGLWLVQPAFSAGKISHEITRQRSEYLLRYTNFVEMNVPLFRLQELVSFLDEFDGSLTGYGTDWWYMNHLLARPDWQGKIAVVDAVPCENPFDEEKPAGRELDRLGPVERRRREWASTKKARRLTDVAPQEFGGIPLPG